MQCRLVWRLRHSGRRRGEGEGDWLAAGERVLQSGRVRTGDGMGTGTWRVASPAFPPEPYHASALARSRAWRSDTIVDSRSRLVQKAVVSKNVLRWFRDKLIVCWSATDGHRFD